MTRDRKVPTPGLGLLAWCIYVVLFIGLFVILGVDYDDVAKSSANVVKAIIVPVGVAALAMAILTTRWGWWREVMHDKPAGPRWMLVIPALMAIGIIVGLASAPWGDWDSGTVILILAGCLMVGFGEEITNRGLLLVGLRGRLPEARVWLISSGMFALLHAFNIFTGQAVGATIQQMIFAFLVGSVFYATRRITGLLDESQACS